MGYVRSLAMRLSKRQVETFERTGIVLIPGVFSAAEVAVLCRALPDITDPRQTDIVLDAGDTVRMAHGTHRRHPVFGALARHPRLAEPAAQLLGDPCYVYQSRLNVKAALADRPAGGYPWHQDYSTWHLRDGLPEPRVIVTFTFLDEVTACNAPLMVIPGSHRGGILGRAEEPAPGESFRLARISARILAELAATGGVEAMIAPAGSVALMHCQLVHGSGENISPLRRAIFSVIYSAVDNQPQKFELPERYAARDFTPVEKLADDCLLQL